MKERLISLRCPCGGSLDATIEIESYGEPATWEYPGSGALWHFREAECDRCGSITDDSEFDALHNDAIQQQLAEPHYLDDDA